MPDEETSKEAALSPTTSTSTSTSTGPTVLVNGNGNGNSTTSGIGTSPSSAEERAPPAASAGALSDKTRALLEESALLLREQPTASVLLGLGLPSTARATTSRYGLDREEGDAPEARPSASAYAASSSLQPSPSLSYLSTHRYTLTQPSFHRVDFDDVVADTIADKKPAWQQLQDSVKDSYIKPKRTVDRHKEMNEFLDLNVLNRRVRRRSQSPFACLDGEALRPRRADWLANGAMEPRGLRKTQSTANAFSSAPYAAPHLDHTEGVESRYDRLVDDVESRLLRTTLLPAHMKTVTRRDFRRAPEPSAGSAAEGIVDDAELAEYAPKPFYSRYSRRDPDYFDFDLEHSVNMYRRPEGRYYPRGPQDYEHRVMGEIRAKGEAPISAHMFNSGVGDWRNTGTSYLSAALRTPSFWEHRFRNIGSQVRDSNPISLDSINRNKPTANKFNTYKDPDLEGLSDLDDD